MTHSLLPDSLSRFLPERQAPRHLHEGRRLRQPQGPRRVHVQGRGQRVTTYAPVIHQVLATPSFFRIP